jgi:hypothetical protein
LVLQFISVQTRGNGGKWRDGIAPERIGSASAAPSRAPSCRRAAQRSAANFVDEIFVDFQMIASNAPDLAKRPEEF